MPEDKKKKILIYYLEIYSVNISVYFFWILYNWSHTACIILYPGLFT